MRGFVLLRVGGEVDLQRGNGDKAGSAFGKIGAFFAIGGFARRAYPINLFAARVAGGDDALLVVAAAEAGDFAAAQVFGGGGGDVDVPQNGANGRGGGEAFEQLPCGFFGGRPVAVVVAVEGKGNGGEAEKVGFGGGGDGAGIEGVVTHVRAVVDAGQDQIRLEIGQGVQGEVDAVGGGAADVVEAVFGLFELQGAVEGERVADAAAVALGGDNAHVGEFGGDAGEDGDALCEIAVVVADEDVHDGVLQWDGGRLKNGGLFAAVFSDGLGHVDIQLLQRILRHKMADARHKCEPMPSIGEYLQRGRCRFRAEKPPKC